MQTPGYIGALEAQFSVNSDGAAVYTVRLPLPPGTNGLTPTLALIYNSSAGNDLLGMGWQIAGLSVIGRIGATLVQDGFHGAVQYDENDRLSLDGNRLVPIVGEYGKPGAVYHTEIETWKKVTPVHSDPPLRSGPDSFVVTTKDGIRHEYGSTPDSQIAAADSEPAIRVWALSRTIDRNGNYIVFAYNQSQGSYAPARIDYTGNAGLNPQRSIVFNYEARPDPFTHYTGGHSVSMTQRLASIDVYVEIDGASTKVLTYGFEYEAGAATGRSRLLAVTQMDGSGAALTPTTFVWQEGALQPLSTPLSTTPTAVNYGGEFLPFDISGDGRLSFLNAYPVNGQTAIDLYRSTADGGFTGPVSVPISSLNLPYGGTLLPIDVNGDGSTDLVCVTSNNGVLAATVCLAEQDSRGNWNLQPGPLNGGFAPAANLAQGTNLCPADVNGDGFTDLIALSQAGGNVQFTVLLSNGKLFTPSGTTPTTLPFGGVCYAIDCNGDSQTDAVYAYMVNGFLQIATLLSNGTNLTLQNAACLPASVPLPYGGSLMPMDVNGDGFTDLVYAGLAADGVSLALTPIMNTGKGFVAQPSQTFTSIPFGAVLAPCDLSGDGKTDIVAAVVNNADFQLQLLRSNGSCFTLGNTSPTLSGLGGSPILPVDFRGVGMSGLLLLTQANNLLNLQAIPPAGDFPDLLTTITNGMGGQHSIQYKPLSDTSVYQHTISSTKPQGTLAGGGQGSTYSPNANALQAGSAQAVAPARIVTIPKYVAASYTRSDGQGGNFKHDFRYTNAMMDYAGGRGWQGFATQESTDHDFQTVTRSEFVQAFPLTGNVSSSAISRASDGALMHRSQMTQQASSPYPNVHLVVVAENITQSYTFGKLDATQTISTQFDEFGNPLLVSNLGDGTGAPLYTAHNFLNDTQDWVIGQATSLIRSSDSAAVPVLSSEKKSYDAKTGNLLVHSVWHDQAGAWMETAYTYDTFGNKLSETDPSGSVQSFTYDSVYRTFLASHTSAPNTEGQTLTTKYEYEPVFGALSSCTDANGVAIAMRVNGIGQLVQKSASDPTNSLVPLIKTNMSRDESGIYRETLAALDWAGTQWTRKQEYLDGKNRVYRVVTLGADGTTPVVVAKTLNSKGQVLRETLPYYAGETIVELFHKYDNFGRLLETVKPADGGNSSTTTYEYPDSFTVIQTEAANSSLARRTTTVNGTFNGKSLPVSVTDGGGGVNAMQYDALGQLTRCIDAVGVETQFAYDTLGQKTQFRVVNAGTPVRAVSNRYDLVKRTFSSTDSRGLTVTQTKDALGRILEKIGADGGKTQYEYDSPQSYGLHRMASVTLPDGTGYRFTYDPAGNQTTIIATVGGSDYEFKRTFLPHKRPATHVFPDGAIQTNNFTPGGMVDAISIVETNGEKAASISCAAYTAAGKPGFVTHGNGVTESFAYNTPGQLRAQKISAATGAELYHTSFQWNLLDDLSTIGDQINPADSYSFQYDQAGRLQSAAGPYQTAQEFRYDLAGNLQKKADAVFQYKDGLLASAGNVAVQNDASGNTSALTQNGKTTSLTYDGDGRLTQADETSFTYDYSGRRLSKKTTGGLETYYIAPNYEVTVFPNGASQHTKYLRSPLGLAASITTLDKAGNGASGNHPGVPAPGVCSFHRNQVNSSTVVTDSSGSAVARIAYLPFGEVASITGSDVFRAKFAGRERDNETGFHYFGARYYIAELGRFLTPDNQLGGPVGKHDVLNAFAYVLNSPVCHVDPTGHGIFDNIGHWVSGAASAVASAVTDDYHSVAHAVTQAADKVASAAVTAWHAVKTTAKQWAPYLVDGALILAGALVLMTTPFGGPASAILGSMLLGAGVNGLVYNLTHQGDSFSWEHWGVQLGIGAAVGAFTGAMGFGAGALADGLAADGIESFAIGGGSRIGLQAFSGAVVGAGGNSFSTYITNIDNGRPASQGVGWAAVVGGVTGGAAGALGGWLAGTNAFSHEQTIDEMMEEDVAEWMPAKRIADQAWWKKLLLRTPAPVFSGGGHALLNFGPQWMW